MIDIRNCVFGFKCTADWHAMQLTTDRNIRHCDACEKDVYLIATKEQLVEAIDLNHCVAIWPSQKREVKLMMPTLGVPSSYKEDPNSNDDSEILF